MIIFSKATILIGADTIARPVTTISEWTLGKMRILSAKDPVTLPGLRQISGHLNRIGSWIAGDNQLGRSVEIVIGHKIEVNILEACLPSLPYHVFSAPLQVHKLTLYHYACAGLALHTSLFVDTGFARSHICISKVC